MTDAIKWAYQEIEIKHEVCAIVDQLPREQLQAFLTCAQAFTKIGPNAARILARIAERAAMGAEVYKSDFDDGRDIVKELLAEILDTAVYSAAALEQMDGR